MSWKDSFFWKTLVVLGLATFPSSAWCKAMVSKKTVKRIQLVSKTSVDQVESDSTALSERISAEEAPSTNNFGASNVQAVAGVVTGFEGISDAPVYGVDVRWHFYKGAFIPFGTSYWSSNLEEFRAVQVSILTVEAGLGYAIELSRNIAVPIGVRGGYASMLISLAFEDETLALERTGTSFMPFAGLTGHVGSNLLLGYEGRLPYLMFDKSEESRDNDEKSKGNSLPFYHMGTFAYQFR